MWLYERSTSSGFALASGGLNSQSAMRSERVESEPSVFVTVNGKPSQRPFSRALAMRPVVTLLSGTISQPSTAARGVASWIASLQACRVRHSVSQASTAETTMSAPGDRMEIADHSTTSCGLSASASPDSCGWRTCLPSYQEDIFADSETDYSDWATESRRRSSCMLERLERRRNESACTCWPTAKTPTGGANSCRDGRPRAGGPDLEESARNWASARAEDAESSGAHRGTPDTLSSQSRMWAASRPGTDTGQTLSGCARLPWTPPERPRLSPVFQWWLMGWPWPDRIFSGSGATEWFHWLRHWRSVLRSMVR